MSAPVAAALAGVNGITGAVADVATFALGAVAGGANAVVSTWLGDASSAGALERAIAAIGSAPLSPASYTEAIGVLLGAGFTTVKTVAGTVSSFASLPFRVGADLTNTGAAVITSFTNGLADAASGLLHAVGLSPLISGLPRVLATAFSGAVNVAAFTTSAALNTIAAAIDFGQAVGGIFDRASVLSAAGPAALPATGLRTALVSTSAETDAAGETSIEAVREAEFPEAAEAKKTATTQTGAEFVAPDVEPATGGSLPEQIPSTPEVLETGDELPAALVEDSESVEGGAATVPTPTESAVGESAEADSATTAEDSTDDGTADTATGAPVKGAADPVEDQAESSTATGRHAVGSTRAGVATEHSDEPGSESYGRHASGTTASESSPSAGRHRSDSPSVNVHSSSETTTGASTGASAAAA